MLKYFEVSGFKNFKNKISIDFSDTREYRFNNQCVTNGLLSKMIIYGKNSVGKTNLGLAVFDIVSHLTTKNVTPNIYDYYINSDLKDGEAHFLYRFDFNGHLVEYKYTKNSKRELKFEAVFIDEKNMFFYNHDIHAGSFAGLKEISPTLNLEIDGVESVLKYAVNNTVLPKDHPLRLMMDYVSNMLWFRSLDENRYIGYKTKSDDYYEFIFDDAVLKEFESFLHKAGIEESLIVNEGLDGVKSLYLNGTKPMPFFRVASSGTKALYTFFYWYKTAKNVSLMFIDEFDAFYHFELAETIVSIVEQMKSTQVILTSHNTNLLSNKIMRPDCYFIMTKDNITSFANATTRELREGHNLEKLYMSGEFDE